MQRTWSLFLILFLIFFGSSLFAQEGDSQEEETEDSIPEAEFDEIMIAEYSSGDRNFSVSLGVIIPLVFSGIDNNQHGISVGGYGSLVFNYFITPRIFIGGELTGTFASTRGGNMLYIIPFGVRVGYQFWYRRFEFPVSLMIGAAPQRYLEKGYFGPIVKPGASVYWRFNPEWSFGLNSEWWFVPQWPRNGNNSLGNFLGLTLSARYSL
jgi:hypothetical protein